MTPPERLRHELEEQRARGRAFRSAWPIATKAALDGLPLESQVWWRQTLTSQKKFWGACYSGPNIKPRLFTTDREHGARASSRLIA